jgi:hypothetical protein
MVYLVRVLLENDTFEFIKSYQKKKRKKEIVLRKFQLTDLPAEHTKHISTQFSWSHKTTNRVEA